MINDVRKVGVERLTKANIKEKRIRKRMRDARTQWLNKVMITQLYNTNAVSNPEKPELEMESETPWRNKMKNIFRELY